MAKKQHFEWQATATIGQNPQFDHLQNGRSRLRLRMVSNTQRPERDSDRWVDVATWFDAVIWGKRAESLQRVLVKGMDLFLSGQVSEHVWTDKEGKKRYGYNFEVNPNRIEIINWGNKSANSTNDSQGGRGDSRPMEDPNTDFPPDEDDAYAAAAGMMPEDM